MILVSYLKTKWRARWSRAKIDRHHKRRCKKIRAFAKKRSPFYRERDFPVIDKKTMMDNFDTFCTCPLQGLTIGMSSGTSGSRGYFVVSKQERAHWAGVMLAKALPRLSNITIGLCLRANSELYETVDSKRVRFEYYDLQKPFRALFKELSKNQPHILVAPPSMLRMLADNKLPYCPEKIYACAETLDPLDQEVIARYFKQKVHQIYQATEGFLGVTCSHGTLHINEDLVHIEKEWIDQKTGRFVPIITDLYRTTQPIIRYRLDDVLIERQTACPCGSHYLALERIEGRCDDVLYFKDKKGALEPLFPDFIRRQILQFDVEAYQVVQRSAEELEVYTTPQHRGLETQLKRYLKERGFVPPNITLLKSPPLRAQHDKLRRVRCENHR